MIRAQVTAFRTGMSDFPSEWDSRYIIHAKEVYALHRAAPVRRVLSGSILHLAEYVRWRCSLCDQSTSPLYFCLHQLLAGLSTSRPKVQGKVYSQRCSLRLQNGKNPVYLRGVGDLYREFNNIWLSNHPAGRLENHRFVPRAKDRRLFS